MEGRKLFNWEIEKEYKDMKYKVEVDKTLERTKLEEFLLKNSYYNGKSEEIFTDLANLFHHHIREKEAEEIFGNLLTKWKVESKKFPDFPKKITFIVDKVARHLDYIPKGFLELIGKFTEKKLETCMNTIVDRYSNYKRNTQLIEILDDIEYEFTDSYTLYKIINTAVISAPESVNKYFKLALKYKKDPIALLNNINFTDKLFENLEPDTLKELLDLPGIQTKFDKFILVESFMEAIDKIPELDARFFIDISNKLDKINADLAIRYAIKATTKNDFKIALLKDCHCSCEKDSNTKTSVADALLARALKKKDIKEIMQVLENTFLLRPTCVADLDIALKYSELVVKLTKANQEFVKVHLQLLNRRVRSIDGPEGIMEDDRYKHKEGNAKFIEPINYYRELLKNMTGQKIVKG